MRASKCRHVAMTPVAGERNCRWIGCKHRSVAPCSGRHTIWCLARRLWKGPGVWPCRPRTQNL